MTPGVRLGWMVAVAGLAAVLCMRPEAALGREAAAATKPADAKRRPAVRPPAAARKAVRPAPRATARSGGARSPAARLPLAPPPPTLETRVAPLPVWENRPDWKPLTAPFLYPVPETAPDKS